MARLRQTLVLAVLLAFVAVIPAQAAISPQQKLMAKRAAELDAYRLLAERILGLQIAADSTVRDFVGESDNIATGIDTFIKGANFTGVRHFSDGSCEVDARVTLQQVVTTIQKIHDEEYRGGRWNREDFEKITKRTERKVIEVTGSGAARAQSAIPDPADEPIVGPIVGTRRNHAIHLPEIYSQHSPAERLKAKRAAELDAYRKLIERMYGLEIESGTKVRDFVTASDVIRARTEGELKGVRFDNIRYAPDGVVEVEASLTLRQVITIIQKVYDEEYTGGKWQREDFEKITKKSVTKTITVVGTGALDTEGDAGGSGRHTVGEVVVERGEEVIIIE